MGIMMPPLEMPPLGIPEDEAQARFESLQKKLVPLWEHIHSFNAAEQTIVVVPSQTIEFDWKGAEMQAYEERMLFMLLLLRQPRARMVYATSQTILPSTVDYYLSLLPGVVYGHALDRFVNVAVQDRTPRPLTIKLLERPHVCERIRSLIKDPDHAHLVAYNVTKHERDLALRLGIPLYGADPKFWPLGSKTGSRQVFEASGVSYPIGSEDLHSLEDVLDALNEMRRKKPRLRSAIVKLNEGISGEGNAVVDLSGLPHPDDAGAAPGLKERLRQMRFEARSVTFDSFFEKMETFGGIVEERIEGHDFCSPSVQLRITPLHEVEVLSTHDQLLGGPSGQSYLGSKFPADPRYRPLIGREARAIGQELAKHGVLGRFAIDFVVVRDDAGEWRSYAVEINLRKGGTTHPFLILQFLTDGAYDEEAGVFRAPDGVEKCYVTSDHLENTLYHAFTPAHLCDILIRHELHFDQACQTGILVHMLATIGENGRFGVVAVGDTLEQAQELYERVQQVLEEEALEAIRVQALPEF
jgi:hypothetical protein